MSPFLVFALWIQACLIQSVFSQSCGPQLPYGPSGLNSASCQVPQLSAGASAPRFGATYGGTGTGQVAASGDIGASGQTVVIGSVPVLGSVDFGGRVAAAGSVSISGQCGCGCT